MADTVPLGHRPSSAILKHVFLSEVHAVMAVMHKNSRWSSATLLMAIRDSPAIGMNLNPKIAFANAQPRTKGRTSREAELLSGFLEVKRGVKNMPDIREADLTQLLAPFFAILRSPLSTGPISSAALASLHSFFVSGLITEDSPSITAALSELSSTIAHCKFEASDSSGDEVVLLRIMTVIQDSLCGSVGHGLGDIEVCEMLETVLTTCCQMRLSETLRRSAETTMHGLVRTVFRKLYSLDAESEESKLASALGDESEELKMTVSTRLPSEIEGGEANPTLPVEGEQEAVAPVGTQETPEPPTDSAAPRAEYGLPSILELLRVLINVLDPNDQQHTDSTRLTALRILNAAFEAADTRIAAFPSLRAVVIDPGCKFLFQLARSENTLVLQWSLRTISTLLETMRPYLKLQHELFLTFIIDRLMPTGSYTLKTPASSLRGRQFSPSPGKGRYGDTTPLLGENGDADQGSASPKPSIPPARGEIRDLLIEALDHISSHPSFMVDLYSSYDCDPNNENILERLIDFLAKGVYPLHAGSPETQRHVQYACLELLLSFVGNMEDRASNPESVLEPWPSDYASPEDLLQSKSQKQLILTGAARFNAKPKAGVAFLEESGLIYSDLSDGLTKPQSLAKFLRSCSRIDKRLLGDYLSKPDNLELLNAFMGLLNFKDKPIHEAMREMLESFRLPGEAQQIARITETFAAHYFGSKPAEIKSEDATHVLAYSIILLNTDQHNPQVRKQMTVDDYRRNLRGVNEKSDFSQEYLQNIYDSIRKREIVMPEEHMGRVGFEYAWKELLTRTRQTGQYMVCNTDAFDVQMFKTTWKPVISAIAYAFVTFEDDYIVQSAIAGLRQCANLAGHFHLPDIFDFVVISLSQATSLLSDSLPAVIPNYPVVDVEGKSITVSKLSVDFGSNFKGQTAAVVLFNIVNGNGKFLREGWTPIFEMFLSLFMHSLLPTRMLQMEDFLGGVTTIPLRGRQPPKSQARNEGGLLSALSSYLMTPYGSEALIPEATEADIENTLSTIDCIASCRLDELYGQVVQLEPEALVAAVRALEALAHERTVTKLNIDEAILHGPENGPKQLPYDPASVFLLEMTVSIALQAPQYIEDLWPIVFEHLSALLSSAAQYSILLIERAVVSLLRLVQVLAPQPKLRDQVYVAFDLLSGLPAPVAASVGEQIVAGLILVLQRVKDIVKSATEWNLVFALLRSSISHSAAAHMSLELIEAITAEGPDNAVSLDNFSGLLTVLDDFATGASVEQEQQLQRNRKAEQLTSTSSPTIDRGKRAMDLIPVLHKKLLSLVDFEQGASAQAWKAQGLPLFIVLARQSINASREIRHTAISHLQRILLASPLTNQADQPQIEELFNRVIFHVVDDLLKPQVAARDPQGMSETRLRASALLCKVFMHLEARESRATTDFRLLWIQVLDLLDRLMNVSRRDQLTEAVPESLKNVLLVMNSVGILTPPGTVQTELQKTLWNNTHERMERFLPGFLTEVIPVPPPLAPEQQSANPGEPGQ